MSTKIDENKYIIMQKDNFSNQIGEEVLNVTNVYPIFKKIELGIKNNGLVPVVIPPKGNFETYTNYFERANKYIVDYTAEIYEKLANTKYHTIREHFNYFNIEEIIDENHEYKHLFIKSNIDLIFLNYINMKIGKDFNSYIPEEIPNIELHRYSFCYNNINYWAINTYEPFLNFAYENNYVNVDIFLNHPFFNRFENAFKIQNYYREGIKNVCKNPFTQDCFSYYVFRNNIVIIGYFKEKIKYYNSENNRRF